MKKKQFDFLIAGVSLALSLGAFGGMMMLCETVTDESVWLRALIVGLAFFAPALLAFAGVRAANGLRKNVKAAFPPALSLFVILGLVLTFVFGFAGQLLYGLRVELVKGESSTEIERETKVETEIVSDGKPFDIFLLLDNSGSMYNEYSNDDRFTPLKQSANAFVDGIPEQVNLGIAYFDDAIFAQMDMTPMNAAGKTQAHDFINKGLVSGGTKFDVALQAAYDVLTTQGGADTQKAVVMVTDGGDVVSEDVKTLFTDAGITVYGVQIGYASRDLIDLIDRTGGMNVSITQYADSVLDDLTQAFAAISTEVEKEVDKETKKEVKGDTSIETDYLDGLLTYDENGPTVYGVIVRFVCVLLLALAVQAMYFGKPTLGGLLSSVIAGAAVTAALTFAHSLPTVWIAAAVAALCVYTCYLMLEPSSPKKGEGSQPPAFGGYPAPPELGANPGQGGPQQTFGGYPAPPELQPEGTQGGPAGF